MPVEIIKVVLVESITVPSNTWGSVEVWTANSVKSGNMSVILKTLFLHDFLNIMDHTEDGSTYELNIEEHKGLDRGTSTLVPLDPGVQLPHSTSHGSDQVMYMTGHILPIYHILFVGAWSVHLDTKEIAQERGQAPRQPRLFFKSRPANTRLQTPPQPFNLALSPSPTQTPAQGPQLSHNPDHYGPGDEPSCGGGTRAEQLDHHQAPGDFSLL